MDVREKLVELSDIQVLQREIECVKRKSYTNCTDCFNCDLLMTDERILSAYANAIDALQNANGVTVQEWISVNDRLPEEKVDCIVHYKHAYCDNDDYWAIGICFYDGEKFQMDLSYKVTYWQYLPHPPKGE